MNGKLLNKEESVNIFAYFVCFAVKWFFTTEFVEDAR